MHEEFYIKNNQLISPVEWKKIILEIKSTIKEDLQGAEKAKSALSKELIKAVDDRVPDAKFGVLFSGGVDSSLIALLLKKAGKNFTCYTIGFKEEDTKQPEDVEEAVKAAEKIGVNIKVRVINLQEAEELIKKTISILGEELNNVVNVGVGGVVLGCVEMAKKDGVKYLFSGLGSEEIFAGYQRHKLADNKQDECWNGLVKMYERDLLRDFAIASASKVSLLTPFLDEGLIATAMRVPAKLKIHDETSKLILREAAQELGLPKEIAWRAKRAAQYGSRLDKAIDKLARKKGFEYKKNYLKSLE